MTDIVIVLRALEFAADRHRHQFRKGEGKVPYINHPIGVATLLAQNGENAVSYTHLRRRRCGTTRWYSRSTS